MPVYVQHESLGKVSDVFNAEALWQAPGLALFARRPLLRDLLERAPREQRVGQRVEPRRADGRERGRGGRARRVRERRHGGARRARGVCADSDGPGANSRGSSSA